MQTKLMYLVAGLLVSGIGVASADKLPKGTEHSPPYFLDESETQVRIEKKSPGWAPAVSMVVANMGDHDHLRLVTKQNGKVLSDWKCRTGGVIQAKQRAMNAACDEPQKELTVTGPIELEVIIKDDKTDKEYSLRTFKTTVKNWKNWPATNKEKLWGSYGEDLAGPAWAYMDADQALVIRFWVNSNGFAGGESTLRCSVDGKPLDKSLKVDPLARRSFSQDTRNGKGDTLTYTQTLIQLASILRWGTAEEVKENGSPGSKLMMIEHPGAWVCQLRKDQETLREFAFTVGKDGRVAQDEMNAGKDAIPTLDNVAMIEMHIPKDGDKVDDVIQGDKWKASMLWGLAWPQHAKLKKIHGDYPTKAGKLGAPQ